MKIELVAAEPDVAQPVYITFDERGRMWVVQYLKFPFPAGLKIVGHDRFWRVKYDKFPPPAPPNHVRGADKVTIFEDRNRDGRFESHKDFVTGLNITTAALPGTGGVWIMNPPYLLFYPDADSNDIPDGDPVVHLAGFGLEDMHAVANSLTWGPDGWLYGCQGSTCTATVTRPGIDEPGLHFKGQCIWRYHPQSRKFELFAEGGWNNFGIAVDSKWRLFTGSNGGVIGEHYVQGGYYRKNWGKHGELTNPYAFGWLKTMTDHSSRLKLSQAMTFCADQSWPESFQGQLFVARVLQRRIDLCELRPEGSTYSAHELRTVVKTSDPHFRPVDLKLGPDGAIYIADWHEPNVNWNTTAGGNPPNKASGRIYRLKPTQPTQPLSTFQNYATASPDQLLALLDHPNQWHRETARRLLRERSDSSLVPRLTAQIGQQTGQAALERLWALHAVGGFTKELAPSLLHHLDPFVRIWTIRLLGDEGMLTEPIEQALVQLARSEAYGQVRSQLACTVKRLPARVALPVVEALVNRAEDSSDRYQPLLLWWVVEAKLREEPSDTLRWLERSPLWSAPLFRAGIVSRLGRRFTTERSQENLKRCARLLNISPSMVETHELLRGMSQGLAGNKVDQIPDELERTFQQLWKREKPDAEMIQVAVRLGSREALVIGLQALEDKATTESDRIILFELLAERGDSRVLTPLLGFLSDPSSSSLLKSKVLAATQSFSDDRVAQAIIDELKNFDPTLLSKALTILASRRSWSLQLLRKIDSGVFSPRLVPREIVLTLQQSGGETVQPLITKFWGMVSQTPLEKRQRIRQVSSLLSRGKGDNKMGQLIFSQVCASCHSLFGQGQKTGPDLTGIDRDNIEGLLDAIIDPGGAILPEYMAFEFTIKRPGADEPQRVTGYIVEENANRVLLKDVAGTQTAVARKEILDRRALNLSIMPEGLLDAFNDQQIRDLFAYLQSHSETRPASRP